MNSSDDFLLGTCEYEFKYYTNQCKRIFLFSLFSLLFTLSLVLTMYLFHSRLIDISFGSMIVSTSYSITMLLERWNQLKTVKIKWRDLTALHASQIQETING